MASTNVKLGHGTTVRIGRGATPTWTPLTGFDTVSFPDQTRADVDVTHSGSPGETEESIPGLRSASDWKLSKHFIQGMRRMSCSPIWRIRANRCCWRSRRRPERQSNGPAMSKAGCRCCRRRRSKWRI